MSGKDFDLEQLAAYLHFTPDQIQKLIKRGELPGRKVQGQWRFSESEIHHWLENRIGMSSPEELEEVERWFERSAPDEESPVVLADLRCDRHPAEIKDLHRRHPRHVPPSRQHRETLG
jgi:PTS system nitrogen regulatory IIA component